MNLGLNVRKYYTKIIDLYGSTVSIVYHGKDKCPGAFDINEEYDYLKDKQYHLDNPTLPQCKDGYLNNKIEDVKCSIYDRYSIIENEFKVYGELSDNDYIFIFKYDVDLEDVNCIILNNEKYHLVDYKKRYDCNVITNVFAKVKKDGDVDEY